MKRTSTLLLTIFLVTSASLVFSQTSKYSGIYSGSISTGFKVLLAATNAGRLLGLDGDSSGLGDALNPAVSTVSATGKIKGSTPNKTSVVASIGADFKVTGTASSGGRTARITGKRIYK